MFEDVTQQGLFSLVELNHLRVEAMNLFEQCLTSGDDAPLLAFIELQIVQDPPRLLLLRDLADDLQQRLLSLREYHFDVRDRIIRTFRESYDVDLTPLSPPNALDRYHLLTTDAVLALVQKCNELGDNELLMLRKMVEASVQMAAQLNNDIQLTTRLQQFVLDWLDGINATIARRYWNTPYSPQQQSNQH